MEHETEITQLTSENKEFLKNKSPFALPDNPSEKRWSAAQIKQKMYEGFLVLFEWLQRLANETNSVLQEDDIAFEEIIESIDKIVDGTTIVAKSYGDEDGSNIKVTYETKADATSKFNTNKDEIDKIKDGTTVVGKADNDADGTSIKTYARSLSNSLQGSATQWLFTIKLIGKLGNELNSITQVFGSASQQNAGLLSAADKTKIDLIANDIATALQTAKTYTDNKVDRSNLVSVLGEASQALNGLMSATDKARLDTLYALLSDDDSDTVVDTIQEVLNIFNNYPEGADLVGALALKVDISAIVDNLNSDSAVLPLSAKQGKVLKALVDNEASTRSTAVSNILDGTSIVGKASKDSDGNVIKDTYMNRSDAFAVAMVEVSDYDKDTGVVTLTYNSNGVSSIDYNSDTGVVTFTY